MPERPTDYTHPNVGPWKGPDQIFHIQLDGGVIFARRGGKAIDKHGGWFRLAQANSSNLAGFAEVVDYPDQVFGLGYPTHPVSELKMTSTGDKIPANFGLQKSYVFPCSNRNLVEGDIGHDFDVIVPGVGVGNPVQCVNLNSSTYGVLRATELVSAGGEWGAFSIPPAIRYGNPS